MSDENLFEVFEGDDIFDEEEDGEIRGEPEGEGQNKTFLIAVGILGGLLVLAIGFFAVWALVLNPRMQTNKISEAALTPEPTEEVIELEADLDATANAEVEAAIVVEEDPTATPKPTVTPTPVVKTSTPEPEDGDDVASDDGDADSSTAVEAATEEPRRTATPTPTKRPTSTPKPTTSAAADRNTSASESGADEPLPESGFGQVMLIVAGVVLIGVAFMARKLRSA